MWGFGFCLHCAFEVRANPSLSGAQSGVAQLLFGTVLRLAPEQGVTHCLILEMYLRI